MVQVVTSENDALVWAMMSDDGAEEAVVENRRAEF